MVCRAMSRQTACDSAQVEYEIPFTPIVEYSVQYMQINEREDSNRWFFA